MVAEVGDGAMAEVGGDVQTFGPLSLASELGGFQDGSGVHL